MSDNKLIVGSMNLIGDATNPFEFQPPEMYGTTGDNMNYQIYVREMEEIMKKATFTSIQEFVKDQLMELTSHSVLVGTKSSLALLNMNNDVVWNQKLNVPGGVYTYLFGTPLYSEPEPQKNFPGKIELDQVTPRFNPIICGVSKIKSITDVYNIRMNQNVVFEELEAALARSDPEPNHVMLSGLVNDSGVPNFINNILYFYKREDDPGFSGFLSEGGKETPAGKLLQMTSLMGMSPPPTGAASKKPPANLGGGGRDDDDAQHERWNQITGEDTLILKSNKDWEKDDILVASKDWTWEEEAGGDAAEVPEDVILNEDGWGTISLMEGEPYEFINHATLRGWTFVKIVGEFADQLEGANPGAKLQGYVPTEYVKRSVVAAAKYGANPLPEMKGNVLAVDENDFLTVVEEDKWPTSWNNGVETDQYNDAMELIKDKPHLVFYHYLEKRTKSEVKTGFVPKNHLRPAHASDAAFKVAEDDDSIQPPSSTQEPNADHLINPLIPSLTASLKGVNRADGVASKSKKTPMQVMIDFLKKKNLSKELEKEIKKLIYWDLLCTYTIVTLNKKKQNPKDRNDVSGPKKLASILNNSHYVTNALVMANQERSKQTIKLTLANDKDLLARVIEPLRKFSKAHSSKTDVSANPIIIIGCQEVPTEGSVKEVDLNTMLKDSNLNIVHVKEVSASPHMGFIVSNNAVSDNMYQVSKLFAELDENKKLAFNDGVLTPVGVDKGVVEVLRNNLKKLLQETVVEGGAESKTLMGYVVGKANGETQKQDKAKKELRKMIKTNLERTIIYSLPRKGKQTIRVINFHSKSWKQLTYIQGRYIHILLNAFPDDIVYGVGDMNIEVGPGEGLLNEVTKGPKFPMPNNQPRDGLKEINVGDIITHINGVDVTSTPITNIKSMIDSAPSSTITLTMRDAEYQRPQDSATQPMLVADSERQVSIAKEKLLKYNFSGFFPPEGEGEREVLEWKGAKITTVDGGVETIQGGVRHGYISMPKSRAGEPKPRGGVVHVKVYNQSGDPLSGKFDNYNSGITGFKDVMAQLKALQADTLAEGRRHDTINEMFLKGNGKCPKWNYTTFKYGLEAINNPYTGPTINNAKEIYVYPKHGTITTFKCRSVFQGQPSKTGDLVISHKDYIFYPKTDDPKHAIVGCGSDYNKGGEKETGTKYMDLLQPSSNWPLDHFAPFVLFNIGDYSLNIEFVKEAMMEEKGLNVYDSVSSTTPLDVDSITLDRQNVFMDFSSFKKLKNKESGAPGNVFSHLEANSAAGGGYRKSKRGGYRKSKRGGYRKSKSGGYRKSKSGGYRKSKRGGYRKSKRGGYRKSKRSISNRKRIYSRKK